MKLFDSKQKIQNTKMEELFTLGLCSENKSFLSDFAKNRLFERHLVPLIFSYIFAQECKKSCLCRPILDHIHYKTKETLEEIPKIVHDNEFKNYVRAVITRKYIKKQETFHKKFIFCGHDIFRHVKITAIENCTLNVQIYSLKISEIKNTGKVMDFFPKLLCPYSELSFIPVPDESGKIPNVTIKYDTIDLNANVKEIFLKVFAVFFLINEVEMVCKEGVLGYSMFKGKLTKKMFDKFYMEIFPLPEIYDPLTVNFDPS